MSSDQAWRKRNVESTSETEGKKGAEWLKQQWGSKEDMWGSETEEITEIEVQKSASDGTSVGSKTSIADAGTSIAEEGSTKNASKEGSQAGEWAGDNINENRSKYH